MRGSASYKFEMEDDFAEKPLTLLVIAYNGGKVSNTFVLVSNSSPQRFISIENGTLIPVIG
jgi:hypothetical protein